MIVALPGLFSYLFWGLMSLSTFFQSYHDGVWMWQGAQCSLLECCLTEISRPRHFDIVVLTSDPPVANSTTKVPQPNDHLLEEAGSVQDGQMTLDRHHEAKENKEEDPTPNKELEEDIQILALAPMEVFK